MDVHAVNVLIIVNFILSYFWQVYGQWVNNRDFELRKNYILMVSKFKKLRLFLSYLCRNSINFPINGFNCCGSASIITFCVQ